MVSFEAPTPPIRRFDSIPRRLPSLEMGEEGLSDRLLERTSFLIDIGEDESHFKGEAERKAEEKAKEAKELEEKWRKVKSDSWMIVELCAIRGFLRERKWVYPLMLVVTLCGRDLSGMGFGYVIGLYYKCLVDKDLSILGQAGIISTVLMLIQTFFLALSLFAKEACTLKWRKTLVDFTQSWYLRGTGGLHMHYVREVSTSDQRVTTDIITMTKAMGDFVYLIAFSPFMSVYLLFVITIMFGWLTPVVLTVQLIICFAVNKFVVGLLTPKVYFAEQAEGAFRGSVAQACMYAEPIGFCTPKAKWVGEKTRIERLFAKALEAQWAVLYKRVLLSATSIMSSQFGTFTSYVALMVALLYFQKEELDDETITERYSSGLYYCSYLIGEITQLVGAFEALSRVHGSAGRVAELLNATEFLEARRDLPHWYQRIYWFKSIFDLKQEITKTNKDIISEPDDALRWPIPKYVIKNDTLLTVRNLDLECRGRTLLRDFNFSITRGRNVLVSGPSGCGKTSLLRALAGISPISRGDVVWNISLLHSQAIFAPQDPFCFAGTMKENVTYPHVGDTLFDEFSPEMISWNEAAHNALAAVGLYFVLDPTKGLETVADWPSILSKGEVQRLSIGRIFMFRPILAILDEATSGLQESLTATIYARLDAMGITIITVGHRESLAVHHDVRITMGVDDLGSYKIDELDHEWTKSVLRSDIKKGLSCL